MSARVHSVRLTMTDVGSLCGSTNTTALFPPHVCLALDAIDTTIDQTELLALAVQAHEHDKVIPDALRSLGQRLEAVYDLVLSAAHAERNGKSIYLEDQEAGDHAEATQ